MTELTQEQVQEMLVNARKIRDETPWKEGWRGLERLAQGWLEIEQENARLRKQKKEEEKP